MGLVWAAGMAQHFNTQAMHWDHTVLCQASHRWAWVWACLHRSSRLPWESSAMAPKGESDPFQSMRDLLFQSHVFHCKLIVSGMCGVPLIGIHSEAFTCKCFTARRASADTAIHPNWVWDRGALQSDWLTKLGSSSRCYGAILDKPCQLSAPQSLYVENTEDLVPLLWKGPGDLWMQCGLQEHALLVCKPGME